MELWTSAHARTFLPALAVMTVLAAALRLTIGSKPLKIRMIPFQILACVLVLLEIGKQVLSFAQGYDLYHIPLHFCSLFIFAVPVMAFYNGKRREQVQAVAAALGAAVTALMLIYPNLIYSAGNIEGFFTDYFDFHTVAFHNLVVFNFVLTVALEPHTPQPRGEGKAVVLFTAGFCTAAAVFAQLLKTNYANFYTCNIAPLETVRQAVADVLGAGLTQLLYVLTVAFLHILFVLGAYWLYRLLRRVFAAKKEKAVC